jgi:hypothetical protein
LTIHHGLGFRWRRRGFRRCGLSDLNSLGLFWSVGILRYVADDGNIRLGLGIDHTREGNVGTYDSSVDGLLQLFLGDHNAIVVTECGLGGIRFRGGLKYATRTNAHQYRL